MSTEDDMQTIYEELEEADAFVLGSPIYVQMSPNLNSSQTGYMLSSIPPLQRNSVERNMALIFFTGQS